jgi:hypothetical protein
VKADTCAQDLLTTAVVNILINRVAQTGSRNRLALNQVEISIEKRLCKKMGYYDT